jgi:hypothetical protein
MSDPAAPDDDARRVLLQRQLDIMWRFATDFIIDQIDLELALWEPSTHVCTVHQTGDGWSADWLDEDKGPLPDATIAWLLWHIEWWWNDTVALVSCQPGIEPSDHRWSGGTDGIVLAKKVWDEVLAEADLDGLVAWHLPEPQPIWFIAAWVNTEVTKNLAEINQLKAHRANR